MIVFTRGSTGFVHDKTTSLFPGAAASVGAVGFLPIETVSANVNDSTILGEYLVSSRALNTIDSERFLIGALVMLSANEIVSVNDWVIALPTETLSPNAIDSEAYDLITEDLSWLGIEADEIIIQSKRVDIYYED